MRAQRTVNDFGIARYDRIQMSRGTNIVVAEPMPGEKQLLGEFISAELSSSASKTDLWGSSSDTSLRR